MKARMVWFTLGLVFAVTLAVVIGQRLSDEAMAVVVGVVAGVAASIPTSLVVVWFAARAMAASRPAAEPPPPAEPRVVVMTPPVQTAGLPSFAPYGLPAQAAAMYAPAPRQFSVIGGAEVSGLPAEASTEVLWRS